MNEIAAEALDSTSTWPQVVRSHGVSDSELTAVAPMFTAVGDSAAPEVRSVPGVEGHYCVG